MGQLQDGPAADARWHAAAGRQANHPTTQPPNDLTTEPPNHPTTQPPNHLLRAVRWAAAGSVAYFGLNLLAVVLGSRRDGTRPADCAIVLGAAVWPGEQPSLTLRARTERGGEVYRSGAVRHLILTGGLGDYPPSEAEAMRRILAALGLPPEAMVLEDQAATTAESARLCAQIMRGRGWRTALLVSDPWHLPRAARLFRREGIRVFPCPAFGTPTWVKLDRRLYYSLREAIILGVQRLHL